MNSLVRTGEGQRQLRFLFFTADKYPVWRVDVSVLFGRELTSRGHLIDFVLPADSGFDGSGELKSGSSTFRVAASGKFAGSVRQPLFHLHRILNDLCGIRLLRQNPYDIVVVKDKFLTGLIPLYAAKLFGVKTSFWLSWPFPEQYLDQASQSSGLRRLTYWVRGSLSRILLYRVLMPSADQVFVQSQQMMLDIEMEGVARSNMVVVPMGVDDELLDQRRNVKDQTHSDTAPQEVAARPTILYLGTMDRYRRLEMLLEAMQIVRAKRPDAELVMVGGSPNPLDLESLKSISSDFRLGDAVRFTGKLNRTEAMNEVRKAWVCVSPFYPTPVLNSTSPTKLIEYMAMGKAVVVNNHPEQSLVIEESGAGLSVAWSAEAFARAIIELIAEPDRCTALGKAGREYVIQHRTYKTIADSVEREFLKLVQDRHWVSAS